MVELGDGLTLQPVTLEDLEALVAIRIAAMRESLERLGRFDPMRARARLADHFDPSATFAIFQGSERIGFFTIRELPENLSLDHLYVMPDHQGTGVGAGVLSYIQSIGKKPITLNALRDSASNRFYKRHGFIQIDEDALDIYYRWEPSLKKKAESEN